MKTLSLYGGIVILIFILINGCKEDSISPITDLDGNSIMLAYEKYADIWLLQKNLQSINISENIVDTSYITKLSQFSIDGTQFAFTVDYYKQGVGESIESNRDDIFIYDLISKSVTRLTDNEKEEFNPQFLFNTNEIVYFEKIDQVRSSLKALNYNNGNIRTIVDGITDAYYYPSISNDGMKITFDSFENGKREIFVVNSDGSGLIIISNNELSEHNPAFSPDGKHIYYYLYENNEWYSPVIYKYEISTGLKTKLTDKEQALYAPNISNNGELISCRYFDRSWLWVCLIDSSGNNLKVIDKGIDAGFTIDNNKLIYLGLDGIYEYSISTYSSKKVFDRDLTLRNIQINPVYK